MSFEWWPLILIAFIVPPFFIWYLTSSHGDGYGSRNTTWTAVKIIAMVAVVLFLAINWGNITTAITPAPAPAATNGTTNTTTPVATNTTQNSDINKTVGALFSILMALIPLIVIIAVFGLVLGTFTGSHGIFGRLRGGDDFGSSIGSSLVHSDNDEDDTPPYPGEEHAPERDKPAPAPEPVKRPVEYNRLIRPRGVCGFCNGDVYTDELNCPHCGAPMHDAVPEGGAS